MTWDTPYDECAECRFFRASRPRTLCQLCGAGEFFEERTNTNEPTADELMAMHEQMFDEGQIHNENEVNAIAAKDDDDE
jgi:hypothetical protein